MPALQPLPLEEVISRLDRAISASPADATELVWVEIIRSEVGSGRRRADIPPHPETTVLVRVEEKGRIGFHQTGESSIGELANAVRQALGLARVNPPARWHQPPAGPEEAVERTPELLDRELATLEPDGGRELLATHVREEEAARLSWTVGRVVLANSHGLRQQAAATCVTLRVRHRPRPGAGRAAASARGLTGLDMEGVFERARRGHAASSRLGSLPEPPMPILLAPEATIALVDLLNRHALSARSFRDGTSMLCGKLGAEVFAPSLSLRDDATDPAGLPFPFDLFGYAKRPVDLVRDGVLLTPAVDEALSGLIKRPATPHAVANHDSRASHVFVEAGDRDVADLVEAVGDGIWIPDLHRLGCYDPPNGRFHAIARGVRRIRAGELAEAVPDLAWESDLSRALGKITALGRERTCLVGADGFWGGITAPAMVLPEAAGLQPIER